MSTLLSDMHRDWLLENRLPGSRPRWLYSSNAKPIIDELIGEGVLEFVSGEFRAFQTDKTMNILGRQVPIEVMVSVCTLTRHGQQLLPLQAAE